MLGAWLWIGGYILASFALGFAAEGEGRSGLGYCLLSLVATPIVGLMVLCLLDPPRPPQAVKSQTPGSAEN